MTHEEMIEVIQAHKDGKEIEFRFNRRDSWDLVTDPSWNFDLGEYRVKPPQIEAWGVVVDGGDLSRIFYHKNVAEEWAGINDTLIRLIPDPNYTGE